MRGGVGLASSGTGGEGKVDAVVSATACVHRHLPAAPPRRALGVEASARGLVRGRPRGRGLRVILTDLVLVHAVAALVVVDEVVFAIAATLVFLTVVFSRTNPVALAALAELAALVRRATLVLGSEGCASDLLAISLILQTIILFRITDHLRVHAVVALVVVDLLSLALGALCRLHTVFFSRAGHIAPTTFQLAALVLFAALADLCGNQPVRRVRCSTNVP